MNDHRLARVLLIDDNTSLRVAMRRGLEEQGFIVFELPSGVGAEQAAHDNNVDVVVTDLVMPEREGIETIRALRKDQPNLPIIVLTGSSLQGVAISLGATVSLTKPVSIDQLGQTVTAQLTTSR